MRRMTRTVSPLSLVLAAILLGCGGAQSQPPQTSSAVTTPPKLPPSMSGGGAASSGATDMPSGPRQSEPSGELEKGLAALERGDMVAAKQSYQDMVKKNPKDGDAYHFLGLISEKEGKKETAEKAYRKALELKPELEASSVNLSALLIESERYDDGLAVSRAGLSKHADNASLHMNAAIALAGKGDQPGSAKEFDEAARLAPSDAMTAITYGHWLGVWKQSDAALAKLRSARPLAKEDVGLLASVGHEMRGIGAFADCVPTFDKAIGIRDAAELRTERALCKLGAKDNAGALADLQAAVAKEPSYAPAHFYLAGRMAQGGDLKGAIVEYEAYLKIAPTGPMAKTAQERVKFAKEHIKK
jgi:Tfp pilus assembly protein PilF